ncbi:hypothetical protein [Cupriavidus lacunae]|uniref:Uncharacterized protein n=1 Tax=Cupriavidus lacunae TaxID=2666307 RepID=A0A370NU61_9BURK|nr:hypothetical protein [Cupriavidus lacunae]RDK09140.1 hypothetical protein DN412_17005 [Cupriavidus lacunae]
MNTINDTIEQTKEMFFTSRLYSDSGRANPDLPRFRALVADYANSAKGTVMPDAEALRGWWLKHLQIQMIRVDVEDNSFGEACCNTNSAFELFKALEAGEAAVDPNWGISNGAALMQILPALAFCLEHEGLMLEDVAA